MNDIARIAYFGRSNDWSGHVMLESDQLTASKKVAFVMESKSLFFVRLCIQGLSTYMKAVRLRPLQFHVSELQKNDGNCGATNASFHAKHLKDQLTT
mmetsp:Transcript_8992/g.13913  ORF Transcript_8992/g.13913 Transcript_8992/m.13913 type:complete len:97 (-) Transcript_8992:156-446(-)